jgi:hypothetical protein
LHDSQVKYEATPLFFLFLATDFFLTIVNVTYIGRFFSFFYAKPL